MGTPDRGNCLCWSEIYPLEIDFASENCVKKVQENIPFEKGVKDLKISLDDKTVWVKYDPGKTTREKLAAAIEKLGYEVLGEVKQE